MISTTEKKSFIDLIDPDWKITTTKTISIRKPNIDTGTDMIRNITNFVDIPAEPKINKLVQHGNNKKYENNEDSILNDQKVEWREDHVKGKKKLTTSRY